MYLHLRHLSVLTATLLISLSCPLQMVGSMGGSGAALAQAQSVEERAEEAVRLLQVGTQQYQRGELPEALETFQTALVIFREIGERKTRISHKECDRYL